jgi:opacity protein-like surface antigen
MKTQRHVSRAVATLATLAAVSLAVPAAAQSSDKPVTLYAGYALLKTDEANLHGIRLSPEFPLKGGLAVVADLSYEKGSEASAKTTLITYLGGLRYGIGVGGARVFGHLLAGGARTETSVTPFSGITISAKDTTLGFDAGGGVEFKLTGRLKLRAGADLLRRKVDVGGGRKENQDDIRATVGVVF